MPVETGYTLGLALSVFAYGIYFCFVEFVNICKGLDMLVERSNRLVTSQVVARPRLACLCLGFFIFALHLRCSSLNCSPTSAIL